MQSSKIESSYGQGTCTRKSFCDTDEQATRLDEELGDELHDDHAIGKKEQGHRRNGRPTKQETQERIDCVLKLLQRRLQKRAIVKAMRQRWPGLPSASIDLYIRRAEAMLPMRYKSFTAKARRDSILFWDAIVRSPDVDIRTKCYAQQELDRRLGVDGPPEHDTGRPFGGGSGHEVLEVVVTSRAEAQEIMEQAKRD
jgi:hypothetical protein